MDEIGEVVLNIAGNIESGKTAQDYENEINNYVVEAAQAAAAKNWKKSEATLVRACTVTARFFGGNSLQLASVLSKLAAAKEMLGKITDSKLMWERALFIWEINRKKRTGASEQALGLHITHCVVIHTQQSDSLAWKKSSSARITQCNT